MDKFKWNLVNRLMATVYEKMEVLASAPRYAVVGDEYRQLPPMDNEFLLGTVYGLHEALRIIGELSEEEQDG